MSDTADTIIEKLKQYTTCDVSDALCKLKYSDGGFLSGLSMWSPERQAGPTRIAGPAYTVEYVLVDDPTPRLPTHYIDSVPSGAIIFVSCPSGIPDAVFGGLMATRALAQGAVGAVIDGRFRDLDEQRGQNFPVFARDVGTAPPYGSVKVSATNVPVKLQTSGQDATIHPGDYLVADLNGVVLLPRDAAEAVLPLMAKQVDADAKVAAALRAGMSFAEASSKFRHHMPG